MLGTGRRRPAEATCNSRNSNRDIDLLVWTPVEYHPFPDGRGYPDGKFLGQLPLPVQSVPAAEAFDAMTTDRPYRKGMSPEAAIKELLELSDKQQPRKAVEALAKTVLNGKSPG